MLDLCKNGLVTLHVCIAIRNLALRKASPDFQRWLTDKDERNQLDFGAENALKYLIDVCARQLPPNNDNKVLEHVLNALIALLWNSPKNRFRMSNKEVIDLQVLTKLAGAGKELNAAIRQRLAILLADLAQLPSVQVEILSLFLAFSLWLSLSDLLARSLTLSFCRFLFLPLSLFPTHTLSLISLSLSLSLSLSFSWLAILLADWAQLPSMQVEIVSLSLSLFLSPSPFLSLTLSLYLCLSPSHTHPLSLPSPELALSHSLALSLSLSLALSVGDSAADLA